MIERIREPAPPRGVVRWLARLPIYLYQIGLGRLLGSRFLRLKHTGRVSGMPRFTVLEVVDDDPEAGTYVVASGWGERSDWVKNIQADPRVEVEVAGRSFPATAHRLPPDAAAQVMLSYGRKHPFALRELASVMGYRVERDEAAYLALGREVPIFVFEPVRDVTD
jgi:deazaflavin-dependent oxidoreductase (nitroreductase family)